MGKRIIVVLIMLLMLASLITANEEIIAGTKFMLGETPCVGDYYVKVRVDNKTTPNDYSLENCSETDENFWLCECVGVGPVLVTQPITRNKYDFMVEYYIEERKITIDDGNISLTDNETFNENVKRIFTLNNVKIVEKIILPPPSTPPFKLKGEVLLIVVVGVFVFLAVVISLIGWFLFKGDKEKEDSLPGSSEPSESYTDELNKLLNQKK